MNLKIIELDFDAILNISEVIVKSSIMTPKLPK